MFQINEKTNYELHLRKKNILPTKCHRTIYENQRSTMEEDFLIIYKYSNKYSEDISWKILFIIQEYLQV